MSEVGNTAIYERLISMRDEKYGDFQAGLIPGIDRERIIGVRTPELRALAKELLKQTTGGGTGEEGLRTFLNELPHAYFDEMQLHAFIISGIKDFGTCMSEVERFLPFVDNWATCDQLSPKVFGKKKGGRLIYVSELLEHIDRWLGSEKTYTVRFGIGMLMQHFLDEDYDSSCMKRVASQRSDEYYINMMIAWYFATALAKQYDDSLGVLLDHRLDPWTHNKAIQKAVESRRISDEKKAYLKTLRIKTR